MGKLITDEKLNEMIARGDGWANLVTGLGIAGRDKGQHTIFAPPRELHQIEVENLYRGDAIATRIVDVLPSDAMRQWFEIRISQEMESGQMLDPADVNLLESGIQSELRRLKARTKVKRSMRWDRLYGGAITLMIIDDERPSEEPVDLENLKQVQALLPMHRYRVTQGPIEQDPTSRHFGLPGSYTLHPRIANDPMGFKIVHADRVLRFQSIDIPEDAKRRTLDDWGDSIYVRTLPALSEYQISHKAAASLVHDFSQAVWTIPGLSQMLASKREDLIQARYGAMDYVRSTMNMVMIDGDAAGGGGGEKFERVATPVSGLPDLLDRGSIRLSAATGMPMTKLFGIAAKGFANEDKSGTDNWNNDVKSYQEEVVIPEFEVLVGYLFLQKESPVSGKVPKVFELEANPLEQQNPTEIAANRKATAETDAIYLDRQVLDPQEVADSRFTSEGYSTETTLDRENREAFEESSNEGAASPDEPLEGTTLPEEGGEDEPSEEAADPTEAFNGAQVTSLKDVLLSVGSGDLPAASAIQMISLAYPVSLEQATSMVAPIEAQREEQEKEAEATAAAMPPAMQAQMPGEPNVEPETNEEPEGAQAEEDLEEGGRAEEDEPAEE